MSDRTLSTSYVINADDIITEIGGDWDRFAAENNGLDATELNIVGKRLWDFMSGSTTINLFKLVFRRVRSTQNTLRMQFRCDAPDRTRHMEMQIEAKPNDGIRVSNWMIKEVQRELVDIPDRGEVDGARIVQMCSNCNRILVRDHTWEEIEQAIETLGIFLRSESIQFSHGVCEDCFDTIVEQLADLEETEPMNAEEGEHSAAS